MTDRLPVTYAGALLSPFPVAGALFVRHPRNHIRLLYAVTNIDVIHSKDPSC